MRILALIGALTASFLQAGIALAQPQLVDRETHSWNVHATAAGISIVIEGRGEYARGEIRFGEDQNLTTYRVVGQTGVSCMVHGNSPGLACHAEVSNLKPGTTYYFRGAIIDHTGAVALGAIHSFVTPGEDPHLGPSVSNLKAYENGPTWAQLSYSVDGHGRGWSSQVQCVERSTGRTFRDGGSSGGPQITGQGAYSQFKNLTPDTVYTCTATANSDYGQDSTRTSFRTDPQ